MVSVRIVRKRIKSLSNNNLVAIGHSSFELNRIHTHKRKGELTMSADEKTMEILEELAKKYSLDRLDKVLSDKKTKIKEKDIYISLKGIIDAVDASGDTLEELKKAKNLYGAPVFSVNPVKGEFLIKALPDINKAINDMEKYSFCFKLSPYHIINTFLAILEAQVTGFSLDALVQKGIEHIEDSIKDSLINNPNWSAEHMTSDSPVLIMPVGAAGCGKSTFYRELSDVINISCDNIRYLLFNNFGPCFTSWESCLSWWVVNYLTDAYIGKGYSVFYNGVNTDLEYRSPITMESPDPLFAGIPYDVRIVYFEPPVHLSENELSELKGINLWAEDIEILDFNKFSKDVQNILRMVRDNYRRTLSRTKEISEGRAEQDPFDILYAVPAPVVKLFVEQSFDRPEGENVTVVNRKDLPDPKERASFYHSYAKEVQS